jgi:hypothetical protein
LIIDFIFLNKKVMEDVDKRYENGCIYMMKHKTDETKDFYIGSSYDLKERCRTHKKSCNNQNSKGYNYKVYKYIRENGGWDCWNMILLYDYPCKNKNELELEEQRAVKQYKSTLNSRVPARTKKEYYYDNKETLLEHNKELYKANKEEINKKRAIKINCDICNRLVRKDCIARHKRTNYCINYQKSLVDELV